MPKLKGVYSPTDSIKGFIPKKKEIPDECKNCKGYKFKNLDSTRR